mmetsp:Transcript_110202/g.173664  ORF Transcript_110202/g.173664 Transcript_110202/m.173664 type:complete len:110 (+) Transcript_110202:2-331(+)
MPARADKYAEVAKAFGVHDKSRSIEENAEAARQAIIQLSIDVGTARSIESYAGGSFENDLSNLTRQAVTDLCMLSTPRTPSYEEVEALYREAFSNSTYYSGTSAMSAKL